MSLLVLTWRRSRAFIVDIPETRRRAEQWHICRRPRDDATAPVYDDVPPARPFSRSTCCRQLGTRLTGPCTVYTWPWTVADVLGRTVGGQSAGAVMTYGRGMPENAAAGLGCCCCGSGCHDIAIHRSRAVDDNDDNAHVSALSYRCL